MSKKKRKGGAHRKPLDVREKRRRDEALERFADEIAKPERATIEFQRLAEALEGDADLLALRFDAAHMAEVLPALDPALEGDARREAALEQLLRLAGDLPSRLREAFFARMRTAPTLEDAAPFLLGGSLLEEAAEAPGKSLLWWAMLDLSGIEASLEIYVRERLASPGGAEALEAELVEGRARPAFERFLAEDARARAALGNPSESRLEEVLTVVARPFDEVDEVDLPLEATLHGPIESAKAARRRQALLGVAPAAPREVEELETLRRALTKDRDAIPAFRADLVERWRDALRGGPPKGPGAGRAERIFAVVTALEVFPPERHAGLVTAYARAPYHAVEEAADWERPHIENMLRRPLDPEPFRLFAAAMLGRGEAKRASAFASAALRALGPDANLEKTKAEADARG